VATIAVVLQHAAHGAFHNPELMSMREWGSAVMVVSFTKWAVPVFVMLSGALLLAPKSEDLGDFYRRRFSRVGVPLVFWSAAYLALLAVAGTPPAELLERFIGGRPYYHLFFLFVITGLYLITPMLRTWVTAASQRELCLAVWLALAIAAGGSMLGVRGGTALTRFIPYIGYFVAGWAIREGGLRVGPSWGAVTAAASGLAFVTWWLGQPLEQTTVYFHDYSSVFLIPMSIAAFGAFLARPWPPPEATAPARACAKLAPLTLGIYLIHPALLKLFSEFGVRATQSPVELWILLVSLLALVGSAAIAWVMSRFRPLATLIGL
jgi:surface polysaccharide O-acyltransferase-like enzyme